MSVGAAIAVMAEQATRRALEKNISETEVMGMCLRQRKECWGGRLGRKPGQIYILTTSRVSNTVIYVQIWSLDCQSSRLEATSLEREKEMTRASALRTS
jgi:hypothetical protein